MSQQPFSSAALRGAVDLSALSSRPGAPTAAAGQQPGGAPAGAPAGGVPGRSGALVQVSDDTFESVVNASLTTPVVLVLWTPQLPESLTHLRDLAERARTMGGRFQVAGVDVAGSPGILQALTPVLQQVFGQVSSLPVVMGLLSGQPMPFYLGVQPMEQVDQLLEKFLEAAVQNAVTGRVEVGEDDGTGEQGDEADGQDEGAAELPPQHQEAYDAIDRGDWAAAITAYEQALAQDSSDELARLGLGQVRLLERTSGMDLAAVRQAAADRPDDVQAQMDAADVDLVGGHVEDGFGRLVETVRRTAGEDRDRARTHLLGLFEVVGAQDPRVAKARQALMSALY
ncbi:tetratricopeptide repeat protein [uncultured Serinicoccus sp.]|uniref:tetratricopeptide repeat protein n=1 Tax=uncultured Serinicoccus sp. TaxID=735514 RepID=UPI0026336DB0|nr:tetratricopeptide repeat protein [uncultured Serinicoccus sp.]